MTSAQTEAAIDRALSTWQGDRCLKKVLLVKRADSGADPDIFDFFFGSGSFGNITQTYACDLLKRLSSVPKSLSSVPPRASTSR